MDRPQLEPFVRTRRLLHWSITVLIAALIPIGLTTARTLNDGSASGSTKPTS